MSTKIAPTNNSGNNSVDNSGDNSGDNSRDNSDNNSGDTNQIQTVKVVNPTETLEMFTSMSLI